MMVCVNGFCSNYAISIPLRGLKEHNLSKRCVINGPIVLYEAPILGFGGVSRTDKGYAYDTQGYAYLTFGRLVTAEIR